MERTDIHCHILPAVDDGAESIEVTQAMLYAAKNAGITRIIATPHLKSTSVDTSVIRGCYEAIQPQFYKEGVELLLGFECNYRLLLYWCPETFKNYCITGTNVLLLELPSHELPLNWENNVSKLQSSSMEIVIAHPERYPAIQKNPDIARRLVEIGCELQLSSDSLSDGLFSARRKCALTLIKAGLINYIASDAHCAEDYRHYERAMDKYAGHIQPGNLL